jgi:hypothetical protein
MKIISKLNDYYDSGAIFGVDDSLIFPRTIIYSRYAEHVDKFRIENVSRLPAENLKTFDGYFEPFIIAFCGTLHFAVKYTSTKLNLATSQVETCESKILYDDDAVSIINTKNNRVYSFYRDADRVREVLTNKELQVKVMEIHKELKVPYFKMEIHQADIFVFSNISLKEHAFQTILTSTQAYQEISMFLSGLNHEEKETFMADTEKIHAHGFDDVSFRNTKPGAKKEKRRNNKLKKRNKR